MDHPAEAAEILDVHPQTVAKMVARGDLTSRGRAGRAWLDRDEVLRLRAEREEGAREPKNPPRQRKGWAEPPDNEHDWFTSVQAADLLGVSVVAVNKRSRHGGCLSSRRLADDGSAVTTSSWSNTRIS